MHSLQGATSVSLANQPWKGQRFQGCAAGNTGLFTFHHSEDGDDFSFNFHASSHALLCCEYAIMSEDLAVAVAGGLCTGTLSVGWVVRSGAAEKKRKLLLAEETTIAPPQHFFQDISIAGGRGAVNAIKILRKEDPNLFAVYMGLQNGDVVRISLQVSTAKNTVTMVGSDCVIHSHSMDVRGIQILMDGTLIVSVADDGCMLVSSGASTQEPIVVSPSSELLCCSAIDDHRIKCASRDRREFIVDVSAASKRKVVDEQLGPEVICSLASGGALRVTQNGACLLEEEGQQKQVVAPYSERRGVGGGCSKSEGHSAFIVFGNLYIL